jgi:predicted nucleic acid-binding protein
MLFDTTFVIDLEREVKRARPAKAHGFLQANPNAPLFISIITVGEFAEGFQAVQQADCWLCLRLFTVLDLTRDIAWEAGQISRQLRAAGQFIGDNDLWIAATAVRHSLPVVTNNPIHFQRITGLPVLTY